MLELRNVSKSYRSIPAVENISFTLHGGEILGYLGPNGSGKSTTVKMVIGLVEPTRGTVLFDGRDIRNHLPGFRAQLGYVPEEAHVYTHLSGMEYLQLTGRLRGMGEALIELKATELLRLLGLEMSRYAAMANYSKGMRQRVLIAAALSYAREELQPDSSGTSFGMDKWIASFTPKHPKLRPRRVRRFRDNTATSREITRGCGP